MNKNLLTLEGYEIDKSEYRDFLGWPSISLPSIPKPNISIITNTISNTTNVIKDQVAAAVQAAQQETASQLQQLKDNAAQELHDIKNQLEAALREEMQAAQDMLKENIKEKWELTKELNFNQLANEIGADISLVTLEEYWAERSAILQDKLTKLEKEYIETGIDKIKERIKTNLKAKVKELLIEGYMKVTGQEMPDIDVSAEAEAALAKVNEVVRSENFSNGIINIVSSTIGFKPAPPTIKFIHVGIGDIANIGEQLADIMEKFPPPSVYFILECINYAGTILTQNGEFLVTNRGEPTDILVEQIITNTTYVPGENPFANLAPGVQPEINVEEQLLPNLRVEAGAPIQDTTKPMKFDKTILVYGVVAAAALFIFIKK